MSSDLLRSATDVLNSDLPNRNRIACWLARTALEDELRAELGRNELAPGSASMRSVLSMVEVLKSGSNTDYAVKAQALWSRLSGACHQHAYELSPTGAEAGQLVVGVIELLED